MSRVVFKSSTYLQQKAGTHSVLLLIHFCSEAFIVNENCIITVDENTFGIFHGAINHLWNNATASCSHFTDHFDKFYKSLGPKTKSKCQFEKNLNGINYAV